MIKKTLADRMIGEGSFCRLLFLQMKLEETLLPLIRRWSSFMVVSGSFISSIWRISLYLEQISTNNGNNRSAIRFTLQKQPLAILIQRAGANSFAAGCGHPISAAQ
jgi:hypothetical protein